MEPQNRISLMKSRVVILTLASLLGALSAAAQPASSQADPSAEARRQLLDLEKDWANAEERRDVAALGRILDDRFVVTMGAKTYDKKAFIALFSGDADPTASQSLSYVAVIVDGDTAVVVGTDTARRTKEGAIHTTVYRYTATYIRRHGRWRALAEQIVDLSQAD
jgi:ketosteroid isomerase-like protein